MTTTENVRAHLAPEAGEGAAAYVDPTDIGDAILEVYDDHEPRIVALEASGNVGTSDLADSAVTTAKIADSAVTSAKIADGTIVNADVSGSAAIDPAKVAGTAVVQARTLTAGTGLTGGGSLATDRTIGIAAGGVGTTELAADAVTSAKIAASAVTSAKIADATIVAGDLADGAVTSAKILDGTIATADLADGAVTSAKIADGTIATGDLADSAVTSAKIADGTIVNADVNASAAIDVSKLSGAVASATVGNLLSSNQATGTDTLSDTTGFYLGSNGSSLASSATYAWQGTRSASYVAGGTASAYMNLHPNGSPAGSLAAVTPGLTYTGVAMLRASAADTLRMELWWYNSGGASIGSSTGASITASTSAWTRATVSAAAPAGAAYAQLSVHRQSGTAGSTVYGDGFGLWLGAGGDWQLPGVPITGIGHKTDNTAGKATYLWDETVPGWRLAVYDSGWRDVSAALEAGASGSLLIRRTATNVHVLSFNVTNSSGTIYIAPAGFAPGSGTEGIVAPVAKFDGTVGAMTFNSPAGGHMSLSAGIKAYAGAWLSAVFPVSTAIPTSLPGTQATAPV